MEKQRPRGHPESVGSLSMSKGIFIALALAWPAPTAGDANRAVAFMGKIRGEIEQAVGENLRAQARSQRR